MKILWDLRRASPPPFLDVLATRIDRARLVFPTATHEASSDPSQIPIDYRHIDAGVLETDPEGGSDDRPRRH